MRHRLIEEFRNGRHNGKQHDQETAETKIFAHRERTDRPVDLARIVYRLTAANAHTRGREVIQLRMKGKFLNSRFRDLASHTT